MTNPPAIVHPDLEKRHHFRNAASGATLFGAALVAGMHLAPGSLEAPAVAQHSAIGLPAPPADGEMGFVVENFAPAFLQDPEACPDGPA